ncbi:MAG: tetratricopeptide repeat protein [Candidatus Kapaibacteriota bacterium]|jgi:tetratricopeptide (TPR) repeat protein
MKKYIVLFLSLTLGCKHYENFTTYFNTYYNAQRLMKESEDEFQYQEIKMKTAPKVVFPIEYLQPIQDVSSGPPSFMQEFIVPPLKLQPVKTKLDSIIIKGSKILSRKSKSNFVEGSLFLMAKSYFYKNEWLPSQIKCSELIDKFPEGDLSPDAHLLFAKNLLIQRKFHSGKLLLSRTVDIAWQKERYDILSEAFRLQAELALFENDIKNAVKPYKQAIAQSEENFYRSRWQFDLASIYYQLGDWENALLSYQKVRNYNPDYLTLFSSYYYEALCLIRLGKYDDGEAILKKLDNDQKYQEWREYTHSGFMLSALRKGDSATFRKLEIKADSAFKVSPPLLAVYYEKGLVEYNKGNYLEARKYFARARNLRTPVYASADKMYNLLNNWEQKYKFAQPLLEKYESGKELTDTSRMFLAGTLYELGANFERLGFIDSTIKYYKLACQVSPSFDTNSARYIYSYARVIADKNLYESDSLKEVIVELYPLTEFGKEVMKELGYTSNYVIDTTKELMSSGLQLIKNNEIEFGLKQLQQLYNEYPNHRLAPRALYVVGHTFEKKLFNYDSAYYYYKHLVEKFPESVYAKDVKLAVTYYYIVRSGQPVPDSLKERVGVPRTPAGTIKGVELSPQTPQPSRLDSQDKNEGGFNPLDYFKDPNKIIKDVNKIISPDNLVPDINLPKNPLDEFKQKKDSTNVHQPNPEVEKPKR